MKRLRMVVFLAALGGLVLSAGPVSRSPRELGTVELREWFVKGGKVCIRVDSGGCTDKSSIRVKVEQGEESLKNTPGYRVTFERVRVDECKAFLLDGVLLEYDLLSDMQILGPHALYVQNPVKAARPSENGLKRALIASTAKAMEMEIRRYEARLSAVGPEEAAKTRGQIAELKGRLAEYKAMEPGAYSLATAQQTAPEEVLGGSHGPINPPGKRVIRVRIDEPCREGSLLKAEGTTRSGPFYHVAGGDFASLQPGRTYELTVYLVYKREYFGHIQNWFVHIAGAK